MAKCEKCPAEIVWVKSAKSGKPMPLNTKVLQVFDDQGNAHRGRESHYSTCPAAASFRR